MGYCSAVVAVLALAAVAVAGPSVADNSLDGGDRVALVAPVLAPPRDSRTHATDRSRQFPILVLLARQNPSTQVREPEAKSLGRNPQPIYVQKLKDQEQPKPQLNRQKRHLHKKLFGWGGGGGGCNTCGQTQYVRYVVPVVPVSSGGDYKGGGGGCGYGGCGGGAPQPSNGGCGYGGCGGGAPQPTHGGCGYGGCGQPVNNGCGNGGCGGGGGGGQSWASASATASAFSNSGGYGKR